MLGRFRQWPFAPSEIGSDALHFPVAVTDGIEPAATVALVPGRSGCPLPLGAPRRGLGQRPFRCR